MNDDNALKYDSGKPAFELIDAHTFSSIDAVGSVMGSVDLARDLLDRWASGEGAPFDLYAAARHAAALLCPTAPMAAARLEVARILGYGARKYAAQNWRKGMRWSRLVGAAHRHLSAFERGEIVNVETNALTGEVFGCHHLGAFLCSVMFLAVHQREGLGTDDRRVAVEVSEPACETVVSPNMPAELVELVQALAENAPAYRTNELVEYQQPNGDWSPAIVQKVGIDLRLTGQFTEAMTWTDWVPRARVRPANAMTPCLPGYEFIAWPIVRRIGGGE